MQATDKAEQTYADAPVSSAPEKEKPEEPIVTDIVPEQLGAGEAEPTPTPAVGDSPKEELSQPGGIQEADAEIAEAKQEEEGEAKQGKEGESAATSEDVTAEIAETAPEEADPSPEKPEVEEVMPQTEKEAEKPATADTPEQRRIDNPVYTLEVVGNRYNPSNFW